jgi:Zn-dependent peptidase ImmA (M78 family)
MNSLKFYKLIQKVASEADQILSDNLVVEPHVPIVDIARNYELLVKEVDLGSFGAKVAGFIDPLQKIIYVNQKDKPQRQAFTVAHELAHWILHQEKLHSEPDKYAVLYRMPLGAKTDDKVEKEANAFAARLLVPRELLEKYKDKSNVATIANIFGVSEELIGYRLQHEFNKTTKK